MGGGIGGRRYLEGRYGGGGTTVLMLLFKTSKNIEIVQ